MKKASARVSFAVLLGAAAIISHISRPLPSGPASGLKTSVLARQSSVATYAQLPLTFEANQGQTDGSVKFLARASGYTLFLTSTEAVLALHQGQKTAAKNNPQITQISPIAFQSAPSVKSVDEKRVLRMKLVGANPAPEVTGEDELPGKSNYFIGNDPSKWRTNVPTYAKVRYEDVYPGIDLVYYGNQRELEYDFIVAPGADPRVIRFSFPSRDSNGAVLLRIDARGDLVLEAEGSELRLHQPVIYQEISGARQRIGGNFVVLGGHQVSFEVARYDASKPLIIDPVLSYSTYLGGSCQ